MFIVPYCQYTQKYIFAGKGNTSSKYTWPVCLLVGTAFLLEYDNKDFVYINTYLTQSTETA